MSIEQIKISVACHHDQIEEVEFYFNLLDTTSIVYEDFGDDPIYEPLPGEEPLWQYVWVRGYFPAHLNPEKTIEFLTEKLKHLPGFEIHCELIENENWQEKWLEHFKPMYFGSQHNLCVHPENIPCENHNPNQVNIVLNPGLAFGSGTHETTALCLNWLATADLKNKVITDYGCGSGILAISAIKLGASFAYAIDHDAQALIATENNMALNQIPDEKIALLQPQSRLHINCDILIANILAKPIIDLLTTFLDFIKPKGQIVLSGILQEQQDSVLQHYEPYFLFAPPIIENDWVCLVGTKK